MRKKQLDHTTMTSLCGSMKRRISILILATDLSVVGQQQCCDCLRTSHGSLVERRVTLLQVIQAATSGTVR
eukprot:m.22682 g.22682  ORF g.22682 m.22682 type:complete len:71 (+) comp4022_c0_seq2:433-645(+)